MLVKFFQIGYMIGGVRAEWRNRKEMASISYDGVGFKFVIIDDYEEESRSEYYIEIKVKKSFLKKILGNALNTAMRKSDIELTEREIEVLKYLSNGLNNMEIAKRLKVSVHTAKAHIHNILDKLSAAGRTDAVVKALRDNLIDL